MPVTFVGMLNVYNNYAPAYGPHIAGICPLQICPREWLASSLIIDFKTGTVVTAVSFKAGKSWLKLELLQDTYEYQEKPKSAKSGEFFQLSIAGTSNNLNASTLQTLSTWRHHQFVALVKDRRGQYRIAGNDHEGLLLQFTNTQDNARGGTQSVAITLSMEIENPAPFYNLPIPLPNRIFSNTFSNKFN